MAVHNGIEMNMASGRFLFFVVHVYAEYTSGFFVNGVIRIPFRVYYLLSDIVEIIPAVKRPQSTIEPACNAQHVLRCANEAVLHIQVIRVALG
jgi:hypothetical protein